MAEHLKHTPLPWRAGFAVNTPRDTILAQDNQQIAVIGEATIKEGTPKGNRDFILRACNNHQKLLNLVDRFIDQVSVEDDADHKPDECDSCELVDDARDLLADLKGEQHGH